MKKYRIALLALIALLLLTPTGVLIARATVLGNFPKEGQAQYIRITKPDRSFEVLSSQDPLYGAVYDLFELTDRVLKSALPDNHQVYTLAFHDGEAVETLKLYVATEKGKSGEDTISCFLLSSANRLYRLRFPKVCIGTIELVPARVDWYKGDSNSPIYTYPEYAYPEEDGKYHNYRLQDWDKIDLLTSDRNIVSEIYRLYDGQMQLIGELSDFTMIAENTPACVFYVVRWEILADTYIEATYVFESQ